MKIPIVKNYRSTVGARLDIDLDGKASLDRLVYGRKRVLGADLVMKSAVGNGGSNTPGRGRHRAKPTASAALPRSGRVARFCPHAGLPRRKMSARYPRFAAPFRLRSCAL